MDIGIQGATIFLIKPFHATCIVLYKPKTSENLGVSDVFRGYRKRRVA